MAETHTWVVGLCAAVEQADVNASQVEDVVQGGDHHPPYPHHQAHRRVEQVQHVGEQEQTAPGDRRTHRFVFMIVRKGLFSSSLLYFTQISKARSCEQ